MFERLAPSRKAWHSPAMQTHRYHLFSEHLKRRFDGRVHKISVDAGFGCPNRNDGRAGAGCIFCDPGGSGAVGIERELSVREQLEAGKEVMTRKYKARKFMAYFQPFSNTYAPREKLEKVYAEALAVPDVVGVAVGTRPDCLSDEALEVLADLNRKTYLWLELGLQSIHNASLRTLGRGHDYRVFLEAFEKARSYGLRVCVHVILGLPGEDREMMLATADEMARLKVDGIKLHLLHILDGTQLGEMYRQGEIEVLEQQEYVDIVTDVLARLHPDTLIHRLTGDGPRATLLAPMWSLNKWEVLNAINAELERRGISQGDVCRS